MRAREEIFMIAIIKRKQKMDWSCPERGLNFENHGSGQNGGEEDRSTTQTEVCWTG